MFKVILLGDTDYEQSHVVTQITKVKQNSVLPYVQQFSCDFFGRDDR